MFTWCPNLFFQAAFIILSLLEFINCSDATCNFIKEGDYHLLWCGTGDNNNEKHDKRCYIAHRMPSELGSFPPCYYLIKHVILYLAFAKQNYPLPAKLLVSIVTRKMAWTVAYLQTHVGSVCKTSFYRAEKRIGMSWPLHP